MPLLRLLVPRTDSTSPLRVGLMLRRAYAVVALGLFALLVHQFWQVLHDRRVPVELPGAVFFGSDVLYGAALYEDLIVDGYSLKTFQFSAATFWVPDVLIYFVWRTILGQVAPAVWATVASLFLLHIAAAVRFGRAVVGPVDEVLTGGSLTRMYDMTVVVETVAGQRVIVPLNEAKIAAKPIEAWGNEDV